VAFDYEVHTLAQLTGDRERLEDAIRAAEPGEYVGTKLRDAIVDVTEKKFKPILGRKAIVLLTDGQDYGSEATAASVVDSATESGTVVYTILYTVDPRTTIKKLFGIRLPQSGGGRSPAWHEREEKAAEQMLQLSEESAGRLYRPELADLEKTFSQISQELRHQYLLAFHPSRSKLDGDLHTLSIQVSRPGLLVRSRGSYRLTP
jgi:VWFA-related protein